MEPRHVIVVGCGRVGTELATRLCGEGYSVSIIDKNAASFRRLPPHLHLKTVLGFGFDKDVLAEAGVNSAYALAAVTSGDNSNILTARIAREQFEVPNVVARIYDPKRAVVYQRLGIQTVATVTWTTQQALERLFPENFSTEWSDSTGTLSVIESALPVTWAGKRLVDLDSPGRFRFMALIRGNAGRFVTPEVIGQEGDRLVILVDHGAISELNDCLRGGDA